MIPNKIKNNLGLKGKEVTFLIVLTFCLHKIIYVFFICNPFDINFKCVFCMTNQAKDFQVAWILMLLMYICDKCMINVLSICHTVNVFLWKIKHETLKPWNFQLTKLVTEHRFAQRSLKCETLKNGDFVAEITPSRSMIEFHLHSFALSNWNGAWKRLFADTKLFEHGVGSIHKTLCIISNFEF